ncbi:fibronectin type III domain-containing protein [Cryobacterium mannosilyticum]|uniref:Fibronectin type III domain-containing protein n=1 Tax=Cryobacterium mannosilyticum TaxID=1259190 RepID=A0A4R8WER0_9MICO|nr:fibronectin type III domain-containing protein [Cryobacterium mannosilyticum]TFC07602.1 fibronectin type III domain-containing protein [Cryobacterium mannosilyticum]
MIRRWLSAHRSLFTTMLSGTVIVAVIATVAIVSGGYTAQRLDLGDAAVWVTNEARQVVGRANTAVFELNTVVEAGSSRLDVVQQGATVLVLDRGNNSVDIVDPATAKVTESVALPPKAPGIFLAGDRAVVVSNGDVWNLAADRLAGFDSTAEPGLSFGAGSVVSADADGMLYAFTPATGSLSLVEPARPDAIASTVAVAAGAPEDSYQLTSVAGQWALFNATTLRLFLPGGETDLSRDIRAGDRPKLQEPGVHGDRVLVAHGGGLEAVPLAGGTASTVVSGRSGQTVAPASDDSCSYAAWGDGTVWRDCAGDPANGRTETLTGLAGDARLAFRRNGTGMVLNDALNGAAWAVQHGNELIDNWAELIDTNQDQQRVVENNDDTPPEFEKAQVPPVAVDDAFGARPGRTVILPVLLNDFDPNGDVLVIDSLTTLRPETGRLDLVGNTQQVQLTLEPTATGAVSFGYTVNDGRGGKASATVTVTIRGPEENSAPAQARGTHTTVRAGGRVTSQVLGDWVDPDGDPIYLTEATAVAPDQISFTPGGAVVYTDAGSSSDAKSIGLTVSDGRATGTGTLQVTVRPSGSVPIVAEAFVVLATAGVEVTVSPLEHVRGGSAPLRLSSVPAKPDVTITPDYDGGSFRFASSAIGVHEIEYAVTDGALTATGRIRVNVSAAPDANSTPITVPHTAFVRGQQATLVDVLATDIDPAGGVLLVTGTMNVPPVSGLRVEILDQRIIRVTLTKPLENGSVAFGYRISNGLAEAEGMVTVIEIPPPARKQAPLAVPDTVSVRVGDAIDVPVLANDEHPDGDILTLDPTLATGLPAEAGLLFASGTVLRYLAPNTTGNFTAVYRVNAPDGQFANAEVRISVREADPNSNNPPVPKTVTARVLAGDTVRIPIPLSGIDPDGDSVQLVGQETNPGKGSVTIGSSDSIDYTAGDYSAGTDTFTYSVVDALGARAVGTVRVGISPRLDGARNPVAAPDEVIVRPGSTVRVRVLGNDSDPDGGVLTITGVEPTGTADSRGKAVVVGDAVSVHAPAREGRYGFIYDIQNDRGGSSSTFLTVVVRADAPRSRPDARDTHLALSDVLDRRTIDVDVLANVFFADGPAGSLDLSVPARFSSVAEVTGKHRVQVSIGESSRIIPFEVANPDDASIVSYAFIWVPGSNDALPQLRKGMSPLKVQSESTLTIDINDYVVAVGGRRVRLTDRSLVQATRSDGADLVSSDTRLVFTSGDQYYGPASISFEVTDGTRAGDPDGRTATIVLPIDVTPRENQPPGFDGAVLDFEPDQTKVIDLTRLTSYPYPKDQAELAYTVLEPRPVGFSYSLDGQQLTLHASESTPKGGRGTITIGVRDGINAGKAGRIEMGVVASTRPLAVPAADAVIAPRGQSTVVDVLANDGATNPFPAVPLRVVAVRGVDGAGVPAGVSITPSADNSRLTVKVAPEAAPADTNLQYQVADATGDPDRFAWGTVRISVQDKPDPVSSLRVTSFADRRISVSFNAGASNNSAVSGFEITLTSEATGAVVGSTLCQATACELSTPGNGQGNAVRVAVAARNGIGLSAATVLADRVWSDVVPPAPDGLTAEPLDSGLRLHWNTVDPVGGGTAMRGYVVTVAGTPQSEVSASGPSCSAGSCTIDVGGLVNGTDVAFTVSARNDAYPALSTWNTSTGNGRPFGPARAGAISANSVDSSGSVTVSWDAFDGRGDGIAGYFVQRVSADQVPTGAQSCSVTSPAPGTLVAPTQGGIVAEQKTVAAGTTSVVFDNLLADNGHYSFVVWGYNRAGCAPTAVATVLVRPAPGAITSVNSPMAMNGDSWDLRIDGVRPSAGVDHYNIRAVDGSGNPMPWTDVTFPATTWPRAPLGFRFGQVVRFQVQACTVWGSCGTWSGTYPASAEASVSFAVQGLVYTPETGVFSWTNGPDNNGLSATYECLVPGDSSVTPVAGLANTCTLSSPQPAGTVRLTVTVNGRAFSYDK